VSIEFRQPNETQRRRFEIASLVFAMILPTLVTLFYFVSLDSSAPAVQQLGYAIAKLLQFVFPVFWVYVICRERLAAPRMSTKGLWAGVVFGLLVTAAMLAIYHGILKPRGSMETAATEIRQKVVGFGVNRVWLYVLMAGFYSLIHSFLEEYYWRWFVFGRLRRVISMPVAIVVSSLAFMLHHVLVLGAYFGWTSAETYLFSVCVAVGGAVWAWLYHRADSLIVPWISHLLVDAAIFLVGFDIVQQQLAAA
jgi:membrane protease YdiL (CAAX protease family)